MKDEKIITYPKLCGVMGENGDKLDDLGKILGIKKTAACHLLSGKTPMRLSQADKLCTHYE
jgi:hypothetical protein